MLVAIGADSKISLSKTHFTTAAIGNEVDSNHVFHFHSLFLSLFSFSAPSISSAFDASILEPYNTVRFLSSKYHAKNIVVIWHAVCSCKYHAKLLWHAVCYDRLLDVSRWRIRVYDKRGRPLVCKSLSSKGLRQAGSANGVPNAAPANIMPNLHSANIMPNKWSKHTIEESKIRNNKQQTDKSIHFPNPYFQAGEATTSEYLTLYSVRAIRQASIMFAAVTVPRYLPLSTRWILKSLMSFSFSRLFICQAFLNCSKNFLTFSLFSFISLFTIGRA